jgi:hypothetical protein
MATIQVMPYDFRDSEPDQTFGPDIDVLRDPNDDVIEPMTSSREADSINADQSTTANSVTSVAEEKVKNFYDRISKSGSVEIDRFVEDVKETLIIYKSMSNMYADWFDFENNKRNVENEFLQNQGAINKFSKYVRTHQADTTNKDILMDFGMFVMTRTIDESVYPKIQNFRTLNNPFHRGLWHMASTLDFKYIMKNLSTDTESGDTRLIRTFMNYFAAFLIMSRPKTKNEFQHTLKTAYNCITGDTFPSDTIPSAAQEVYSLIDKPIIHVAFCKMSNEYQDIVRILEPDVLYYLLTKQFESSVPIISPDIKVTSGCENNVLCSGKEEISKHMGKSRFNNGNTSYQNTITCDRSAVGKTKHDKRSEMIQNEKQFGKKRIIDVKGQCPDMGTNWRYREPKTSSASKGSRNIM